MTGPSLRGDHHVHSAFSDDAVSTPAENLAAARAAGLDTLRMVDHVRVSTSYVPDFLAVVRGLPRVDGLRVLTGVEAKVLDASGAVDAPPDVLAALGRPDGADRVLLADHQFPGPDGPWSPRVVLEHLGAGTLTRAGAVETLVTATARAVRRAGRAQLAHPFSLLPKIGLTEDDVSDELLDALAEVLVATGTPVEVNEKWRCPGARVRDRWVAAGVALVASTDAHVADDVGRYAWLRAEQA
ncbi:PHP domain-containing protein [Cellulomonas fimi]|uniref:PHP domain protein n=1 Tax=Cellulomonas fimi (strain ATCC 484 / DSM 20113 / JCM 1341 / CCUG 24087 / LMG 16345 / NBRC 15513 / NCIMB 8980 / NCTC 7547 / NRS-133) TaxID=590998 RepID=F4H041_CELFA|nr:PHP domain-containing protein [Cellulomonas fimi]AEE44963.1 PHP domain protein [Cellulomonas fimi ATCC 484]NNH07213.1 histidinol-phosphatase [Cellulomonas fimi]VEH27816.1 putative hydrolase [Cellulomonas fimi]